MRNEYSFYLNANGLLELKNPVFDDVSGFLAVSTSGLKSLFTKRQREYNGLDRELDDGSTYVFTRGNEVYLSNPSLGDYIPEGCEFVSKSVDQLLQRYSGRKVVQKATLVSLNPDNIFVNEKFQHATSRSSLYRGSILKSCPGWDIAHRNEDEHYVSIDFEDGIKTVQENTVIMASQTIPAVVIKGATKFTVEAEGAVAVAVGETLLQLEDGKYIWEGEELPGEVTLTIAVGNTPVREVKMYV
jgi:hypothetical protein